MRLRAAKIRNDYMISARMRLGWPQSLLAEKARVPLVDVLNLEKLDYTRSNIEDRAISIAIALGIPVEHVLPLESAREEREILIGDLLAHPKTAFFPAPDPEPQCPIYPDEIADMAKIILNEQEYKILAYRFGLCGQTPLALNKIGRLVGLQSQSVMRRIEVAIGRIEQCVFLRNKPLLPTKKKWDHKVLRALEKHGLREANDLLVLFNVRAKFVGCGSYHAENAIGFYIEIQSFDSEKPTDLRAFFSLLTQTADKHDVHLNLLMQFAGFPSDARAFICQTDFRTTYGFNSASPIEQALYRASKKFENNAPSAKLRLVL